VVASARFPPSGKDAGSNRSVRTYAVWAHDAVF
jgi:hypothetical protein